MLLPMRLLPFLLIAMTLMVLSMTRRGAGAPQERGSEGFDEHHAEMACLLGHGTQGLIVVSSGNNHSLVRAAVDEEEAFHGLERGGRLRPLIKNIGDLVAPCQASGLIGFAAPSEFHAIGGGLVTVEAFLDGIPATHGSFSLLAVPNGVEQLSHGHGLGFGFPSCEIRGEGVFRAHDKKRRGEQGVSARWKRI